MRGLLSGFATSARLFSSSLSGTLRIGDVLKKTRVFTSEDVLGYSKVSHDSNPLHFDPIVARNAGFEDCLVHGMLLSAMFPHIISSHFPGAVYVSQSLNFKSPVFVGDEIIGQVEAVNIRETKKKFLARFKTKCFKKSEVLVLEGEATALLPTLELERVHLCD